MEVSFEELVYRTPLSRSRKKLLDSVSGRFLPGELTGILGPSGAGKTTLLNAISGYRRSGVSGRLETGTGGQSCYIGHEDLLAPLMTAGELMEFAGRLKLPASSTSEEKRKAIEHVMSSLGLEDCFATRTEQLSGGEKRRLSIALELLNDPPVLFMDEPTSGLDTVAATQLLRLLSKLSRDGRTIVITIHQPSASLFDLFNRVYFLAAGKCIYQGGSGSHLLQYLTDNGFVCPTHYNPADFMIELTEDRSNIDILSQAARNGKNSWYVRNDQSAKATMKDATTMTYRRPSISQKKPGYCASSWLQFSTIFFRIILQAKRNRASMKLQILHHIGCSAVLGIMLFNTANDGTEIFGHLKLAMAVILFHAFTLQMVPILYYPFEVKLLKKEHFNQWYRLFPYYMAFTAAKAPLTILLNLLYSTIVYSLVGIPWDVPRFFYFCVVGLITALIAEGIGLTVGALFSATNGCVIGPLSLTPFFGLSMYGFDFMKSISPMMDILTQTSYMRSGIVAMILIQFGLSRAPLDCPEDTFCLYRDPEKIYHFLTLERFSLPQMMVHLLISFFIFRASFYFALKWRLRR